MKDVNCLISNIIKNAHDSVILILADRRYLQADKIERLPDWILDGLEEVDKGVPSDQIISKVSRFLKGEKTLGKLESKLKNLSI